jgi:ABC-type sugar transport system substrate-binding protein
VEVTDMTPPRHDLEAQRAALANLLPEHVDAIAIVPLHVSALNDLIGQHIAKGTSVITFHNDAPESARTLFVGPDAFRSGILAGELLAKLMGGGGRILTFPGLLHEYQLVQRYEGLRNELKRHPDIPERCACGVHDLKSCAPGSMCNREPVEGIYLGLSEQILEICRALQQFGLRVPCVGFTNTQETEPFVKSGVLSANRRHQQGYFAVQRAYEAAGCRGGPTPPGIPVVA